MPDDIVQRQGSSSDQKARSATRELFLRSANHVTIKAGIG